MRRAAPVTSLLLRALTMGLARAQAQAPASPATKNSVGKANKAKILGLRRFASSALDIYAEWKETGVRPDDAETIKHSKAIPPIGHSKSNQDAPSLQEP